MKTLISLIAFALVLAVGSAQAQTAITAITITEPATATDRTIVVSSATGISANTVLYIDAEFMVVQSQYSSGTTLPVTRAANPSAHLDNAQGYIVPVGARVGRKMIGSCVRGGTAQGEAYTLAFNMQNADIGRCAGALGSRTWRWTNAYDTGTPSAAPPLTP